MTAEDRVLELIEMVGDRAVVLHGPREEGGLSGRDVDCVVDGLDLRWPLRLPEGWRLCQWYRYDLRAWYWALERHGEFIAVDTADDPDGLGRDAVRTRSLVSRLDGQPSSLLHAAYLTVKRVRKGMLDPAEWGRIGMVASADPTRFAAELQGIAGSAMSSLLAPVAIAGVSPTPDVVRRAIRLRWLRRFGSPTRAVRALTIGSRRYLERIANPAGLYVQIVGPDGAGKSMLAERLPLVCAPMFRRHVRSHWRPGVLPRPGALLGRAASDPTKPHGREPFGRLPSTLLLAYYWLDFLVGEVVHDVPMKVRSGLVVRERGWWDLAVDPHRYRLRVGPRIVQALGGLLSRPDIVFVLEADPSVLHGRKPELERVELQRQLAAWSSTLPASVPFVRIDVSQPIDEVVAVAAGAITRLMESRAVSRLDSGWVALPGRRIRWWLPRGPGRVATASVRVYQPVTGLALLGWSLARLMAAAEGFRLIPRGPAPPREVRRVLAPHVPPRGTIAVARATHAGRFIALLLDAGGGCVAVAKLAMEDAGVRALEREANALERLDPFAPGTLAAPRVLHAESGLLLLEPIAWVPRRRPWALDEEVARALGAFFRAGKRAVGEGWVGPAHGDAAPWNLLRTRGGWALVDWESAGEEPAFHDVCHYVVQSHALLGRPSASEVIAGFVERRGEVGRAVSAYAEAAELPVDAAPQLLVRYLRRVVGDQTARTGAERRGQERRRRLLARIEGRGGLPLTRC